MFTYLRARWLVQLWRRPKFPDEHVLGRKVSRSALWLVSSHVVAFHERVWLYGDISVIKIEINDSEHIEEGLCSTERKWTHVNIVIMRQPSYI